MNNISRVLLASALCLSFVTSVKAGYENAALQKEQEARLEAIYANRIYDNRDPLEDLNRVIFDFNFNVLDKYIYRPTTVFYIDYVPDFGKEGINNVIRNIDEPSSAVNNVLQGNWSDSANNVGRFAINTTVGLVGFIDVASYMGMERKLDEFGEVLGHYGVDDGPYLMLPVIGPSSVREEVGDYVDDLYWPLSTLSFWPKLLRWGFKGLYTRAQLIDQEQMLYNSLDPYSFVKEGYFQYMRYRVYDGKLPEVEPENDDFLDDYLDEIDSAEF
ncbi:MlaA family lipoprotein [Echinimonas agarilytica]|uniref:VacJ family lipoprotein n=1 Tax=Echinimonas agarilytica TaxID=1215918 RepID=A0AA41W5M8_9GAMM|nr:VacJ family lipoprotein [Echinimonas agarilytica]MCM2679007.1 VacJ family lipoprotein [Echinimonas agarilytica]